MHAKTLARLAMVLTALGGSASAQSIGVSWSNAADPRWQAGEAALRSVLEEAGTDYVSADAQASAETQLQGARDLIGQGVAVLIIQPQLSLDVAAVIRAATEAGVPVIALDRLIDNPRALWLGFDSVEAGRMQARALLEVAPQGTYVILGGPQDDPLADDLRTGQQEALQAAVDSEAVTIVAEADIDAWIPANAQRDMAAILEAQPDGIGAILAADDRIATGAAEALAAAGRDPLPLAGGGGADAALNRIALGTQTVSIWRDPRILGKAAAEIALVLADGRDMSLIEGGCEMDHPVRHRGPGRPAAAGAGYAGEPADGGRGGLDHPAGAVRRRRGRRAAL